MIHPEDVIPSAFNPNYISFQAHSSGGRYTAQKKIQQRPCNPEDRRSSRETKFFILFINICNAKPYPIGSLLNGHDSLNPCKDNSRKGALKHVKGSDSTLQKRKAYFV